MYSGEELIREPPSAKDEAMQAVWHVMAADTGSFRIATMRGTGGDNIDRSGSSLSLAPCMHPHPRVGTPLGTENCIAHHTLLITCRSEPIVPQALDEDPILLNPT